MPCVTSVKNYSKLQLSRRKPFGFLITLLDSYLHHAFRGTIWIHLPIVTWNWPEHNTYHRAIAFCHPQRTSIRHCVMYLNYVWMLSEYSNTIRYCFWIQTQDLFWTRTDLVLHELRLVYQSLQALTHWSRRWYLLYILVTLQHCNRSKYSTYCDFRDWTLYCQIILYH